MALCSMENWKNIKFNVLEIEYIVNFTLKILL